MVGIGGAGVIAAVKGGEQKDTGVDDQFATKLAAHTPPGSSTLFVLVRRSEPQRVVEELRGYGGTVLHTTLTPAAERRLRATLADQSGEDGQPGA